MLVAGELLVAEMGLQRKVRLGAAVVGLGSSGYRLLVAEFGFAARGGGLRASSRAWHW